MYEDGKAGGGEPEHEVRIGHAEPGGKHPAVRTAERNHRALHGALVGAQLAHEHCKISQRLPCGQQSADTCQVMLSRITTKNHEMDNYPIRIVVYVNEVN